MNRLMAAGRPTSALLYAHGVIRAPDHNRSTLDPLEMAFEAEVGVPHVQEFGIDAAVCVMTRGAALAHGFVLEDKGPALGRVTLEARFIP